MRFENRRWLVIPTSVTSDIDFNQVHEANADSLRTSVDGTQTFVKYEGAKPGFLYGKDTYTHSEILSILSGDEWTPDEPE